jgi:hypothetical protein
MLISGAVIHTIVAGIYEECIKEDADTREFFRRCKEKGISRGIAVDSLMFLRAKCLQETDRELPGLRQAIKQLSEQEKRTKQEFNNLAKQYEGAEERLFKIAK